MNHQTSSLVKALLFIHTIIPNSFICSGKLYGGSFGVHAATNIHTYIHTYIGLILQRADGTQIKYTYVCTYITRHVGVGRSRARLF